jgi:lactoylglutathione lyase
VDDLPASLDFYRRDALVVALNRRAELPDDHPIQRRPGERLGGGVEIVLEVDDIDAMYRHVVAQGSPRSAELMRRRWGLTDFRVTDPDGYYWRVTSRG